MRSVKLTLRHTDGKEFPGHEVYVNDGETVEEYLASKDWGKQYTLLAVDGVPMPQFPLGGGIPMGAGCTACGYAYGEHDGEDCPKQQGKFQRAGTQTGRLPAIKPAPEPDPSEVRDSFHRAQPAFTPTPFDPFEGFEVQYTFDAGEGLFGSSSSIRNIEREVKPVHPLQRAKGL